MVNQVPTLRLLWLINLLMALISYMKKGTLPPAYLHLHSPLSIFVALVRDVCIIFPGLCVIDHLGFLFLFLRFLVRCAFLV